MSKHRSPLQMVVVGGSGDLATRKIYPALFALFSQGLLPAPFSVFGYARTPLDTPAFRARIAGSLTCRYVPDERCGEHVAAFLDRCHYVQGGYDRADGFLDLFERMRDQDGPAANRLFYLAIPPSAFTAVAHSIADAGLVTCTRDTPWTRVVIEKPFGHDRASSDALVTALARVFGEEQAFRIDHYLGKEAIQNLMVLRFANAVFEPVWNRDHIQQVTIDWQEDIGAGGRAGYFDRYGIIRDVVQNHMLQVLALVAMEPPASTAADHVRDAKVRVLRAMAPLARDDVRVGQYAASPDGRHPAYRDEPGVAPGSHAATCATCRLRIDTQRWHGVPFLIRAGKGMDQRRNAVTIRFRPPRNGLFRHLPQGDTPNTLTLRIQPDEAVDLQILNKEPGLHTALATTNLDLLYRDAFPQVIPDAYECLLLDVLQGDKSLFIRADELAAAWDVFTPVLHQLDEEPQPPIPYPFGSAWADLARLGFHSQPGEGNTA